MSVPNPSAVHPTIELTTSPLVTVERPADRVAHVILNRPHRRNALTGPLAGELAERLEELNADESVTVVVIRGAGGAFCSGLDLKEFNLDPQPEWVADFGATWRRVHRAIFDSTKAIIGALERAAVNGGASLALACDFLVVGENAFLQVGEVKQGMAAPMNLAWLRLRHTEALAARLALLGERIQGPELVNLGIAYRCTPDTEVLLVADELADRLAASDPAGMHRIKASLRRTGMDLTAEEWFHGAVTADPLAGRPVSRYQSVQEH